RQAAKLLTSDERACNAVELLMANAARWKHVMAIANHLAPSVVRSLRAVDKLVSSPLTLGTVLGIVAHLRVLRGCRGPPPPRPPVRVATATGRAPSVESALLETEPLARGEVCDLEEALGRPSAFEPLGAVDAQVARVQIRKLLDALRWRWPFVNLGRGPRGCPADVEARWYLHRLGLSIAEVEKVRRALTRRGGHPLATLLVRRSANVAKDIQAFVSVGR